MEPDLLLGSPSEQHEYCKQLEDSSEEMCGKAFQVMNKIFDEDIRSLRHCMFGPKAYFILNGLVFGTIRVLSSKAELAKHKRYFEHEKNVRESKVYPFAGGQPTEPNRKFYYTREEMIQSMGSTGGMVGFEMNLDPTALQIAQNIDSMMQTMVEACEKWDTKPDHMMIAWRILGRYSEMLLRGLPPKSLPSLYCSHLSDRYKCLATIQVIIAAAHNMAMSAVSEFDKNGESVSQLINADASIQITMDQLRYWFPQGATAADKDLNSGNPNYDDIYYGFEPEQDEANFPTVAVNDFLKRVLLKGIERMGMMNDNRQLGDNPPDLDDGGRKHVCINGH